MKKFLIASVMATVMCTSTAYADNIRVKVPVLDSQPNYITKTVQQPTQKCRNVEVPIYGHSGGNAGEGALGGMIIGGVLGKVLGGNDKGAAAGAILGGVVGANKSQNSKQIVGYRQEQRCTTTYHNQQIQETAGYTVTYELAGQRHTTHSHHYVQPGDTLTLRLKVTSVFAN
jgi:uncharacterized protein YcfJ